MIYLYDTREHDGKNQHILNAWDKMGITYKRRKLSYCDYSFMLPKNEELGIPRDLDFSRLVAVERKANLDELAGNMTKERERIKKELALAPQNKVLIIENGSYVDMVNGNYRSEYAAKSYFGTFHSFWHEFGIPIIFMPDKNYTGLFIRGYFQYYLRGIIK